MLNNLGIWDWIIDQIFLHVTVASYGIIGLIYGEIANASSGSATPFYLNRPRLIVL